MFGSLDDATIKATIGSKLWRLNNLYKIIDKRGKLITLKLNHSQLKVLENPHNRKIILKSRQQGISTLYLAYNLDSCLFTPNYQTGIQSYGLVETNKLRKRALIMWDYFPDVLKSMLNITLKSRNKSELEFSNNSSLRIGNFRGDTLQSLHISELAKIAAKYPDKAKELKTGAFQAVATDNTITIESTAEGATGMFVEMWQAAEDANERGLTSMDFAPIFLSWMEDPDCNLYDVDIPLNKEVVELLTNYFKELNKYFYIELPSKYQDTIPSTMNSELPKLSLEVPQVEWLISKLIELGEDFNQEYPATPELAFAQSIEGTYFRHQYTMLRMEDRILSIAHNPAFPVYTSWDLGRNDEMVILFWQTYDDTIFLLDEYHSSEQELTYYTGILKQKADTLGYKYTTALLPHDIRITDLSVNKSRLQILRDNGLKYTKVLPQLSFEESINMARQLLVSNLVINSRCKNTILALQNYRKKKDNKLGVYLPTDVHDIHSNFAAAFRYGATGLKTKIKAKNTAKVSANDTSLAL